MAKYNEIMSRVSVTPEMRERVLSNVDKHRQLKQKSSAGNVKNNRGWMRWVQALAAACFLLVVGLQIYHINQPTDEPIDVASEGITEYASLTELEEAVGFDMPELETLPFEKAETVYTNAFGIARINYYGSSEECITISKGKDDGTDVSGDYNEYASVIEEPVDSITVTLKGNEESYNLAIWTDGEYAYAISAKPGISYETVMKMIQDIITNTE